MIDRLRHLLGLLRPAEGDVALLLERQVLIAKCILMFERIWRALLWPFVLTGGFVFVSLVGLWDAAPGWVHSVGLLLYAAAMTVLLVPLARLRWPDRDEALRRLERDSGNRHRPASAYDDTLAQGDAPASQTLWRLHRERMARMVAALRPKAPQPRLARFDPFALRALVLLLVITASVAVGTNAWERIRAAFTLEGDAGAPRYRLHAWVTPPIYTGKPPIVLADGDTSTTGRDEAPKAHAVPEGSVVLVRVHGPPSTRPEIAYNRSDSRKRKVLEVDKSEGQMAEYSFTLPGSGRLAVIDSGRQRTSWAFDVATDHPPSIRLLEDPDATPRGALQLIYEVEDDYGVAHAEARFALAAEPAEKSAARPPEAEADEPLIEPPAIPLRLPAGNAASGEGRTFKDLTSHPWAGLKVRMTLVARDQGGKEGSSDPAEFTLPQRKFTKPLARAIVEQRGKLVVSRKARPDIARALDGLTIAPEKFLKDISVYLALRSAYWRLKNRDDDEGLISVVDQLWDVAVKIEDGDLTDAERELHAAQDRLMQAIRDGASDEQIKRLVAELRAALGRFLKSLAQNARDRGLNPMQKGAFDDGILNAKDLDELLRKIEELAKTGSRELAQRLLGELRDILERLQMGRLGQDMRRDQMMKAVEGLGDIIMKQQKLLDETFDMKRRQGDRGGAGSQREGRAGQGPAPKGGNEGKGRDGKGQGGAGDLAQRQGELAERLGKLVDQLGALGATPPGDLKGAGRAMGDAHRSLDEKALGRATQQQSLALDRLRQGAQAMAEKLMQMLGAQMGRAGNGPRDPLGRPERTMGPDLGTSVKVPDEIDIQRAREILDELRRRLSEPSRPLPELDYLERLIRNF